MSEPLLIATIFAWLYSHDLKLGIHATRINGDEVTRLQFGWFCAVSLICFGLIVWTLIDAFI